MSAQPPTPPPSSDSEEIRKKKCLNQELQNSFKILLNRSIDGLCVSNTEHSLFSANEQGPCKISRGQLLRSGSDRSLIALRVVRFDWMKFCNVDQ